MNEKWIWIHLIVIELLEWWHNTVTFILHKMCEKECMGAGGGGGGEGCEVDCWQVQQGWQRFSFQSPNRPVTCEIPFTNCSLTSSEHGRAVFPQWPMIIKQNLQYKKVLCAVTSTTVNGWRLETVSVVHEMISWPGKCAMKLIRPMRCLPPQASGQVCFNNNSCIERCNWRNLQSPHCATNCLQHIHWSGQGAIMCKLRARHRALVTCKHVMNHLVWKDISAIKFGRAEITFILALFCWLKPVT